MNALHPLTLAFRDRALERAFADRTYERTVQQGRIAIVLGISVYLLYGVLDRWFVPTEHQGTVWTVRAVALLVPVLVFLLTLTPRLKRLTHALLASTGLAAALSFLAMFTVIPTQHLSMYYPGIVLATFFTYNLVGTRFIYALIVDIIVIVGYNLLGLDKQLPASTLVSHNFFILSANLLGGAAGYLHEHRRRQLFLRERELETEREEHLRRSLHDRLTGLANRELLHDRLAQALAHAQRDRAVHAGFFVDLDGFKRINDLLGHETGDRVLVEVAKRLRESVRDTDTVARLGGDEFFVLAYRVGNARDAAKQAERILALIKLTGFEITDKCPLSASIGISLFPYDGVTIESIIGRADQAMYHAKKAGKDRFVVAGAAASPPTTDPAA